MKSNSEVIIKIKMMEGCEELFPRRAYEDDAAFDLRARKDCLLKVGKVSLVPTGVFIELPKHYEAQVRPRSGLSYKYSLIIPNSPGTIDAGYRGEISVIMLNLGDDDYQIKRGDRIAQLVISKLPEVRLEMAKELSDTERGIEGFGSSGKN